MSKWCSLPSKLSSLLRRCSSPAAAKPALQTHAQVLTRGLDVDPTLQTDLVLMYCRCSQLSTAHHLFDRMPHKTMHAFNILISSYVQFSHFTQSLSLFSCLLGSYFFPDHYTLPPLLKACTALKYFQYGSCLHCLAIVLGLEAHVFVTTSIIDMYVKFECMGDAGRIFDAMCKEDVVVWNSMIAGYARAGLVVETLELFRRLQGECGDMDAMSIPSVLSVCGRGGELRRGKEVHGTVVRSSAFYNDIIINNALIEMYAKCGCVDDSYKVFLNMGDRRNIVSWSTLISGFGVHGKGQEALAMFNEMINYGLKPNTVTLTSVLSTCSHSGLVDEGKRLFDLMARDFGLEPSVEHYACMVDLLGRAGDIREALKMIEEMPMEPTASIWGALLGACAIHRSVEIAELAAHKLFALEPGSSSNYITLCSIYEMAGMMDRVATMRAKMRDMGMVKTPGCSWIDMKGSTRTFYQGDVYSSSSAKVSQVLDGLCKIMAVGNLRVIDDELDGLAD